MISISACLIVKNEEEVLARCLDCVKRFADEIIIVDTGSSDKTKEIAARYTDKIFDFTWVDDFSKARNFSFSKACKDYIYVADADEIIDEKNIQRLLQLKEVLLEEIEVVQMFYTNQLEFNTTYNYDTEYRPKLYKRIRKFSWEEPLHEAVRLEPVIYDSDIEIIHKPLSNHAERDFTAYQMVIERREELSDKLLSMYARELFIAGDESAFEKAYDYFHAQLHHRQMPEQLLKQCQCVLARGARLLKRTEDFFKVVLKNIAQGTPSSEICYELGEHYSSVHDHKEATIWYYNAAFETTPELNVRYGGDYPRKRLALCYERLNNEEQSMAYHRLSNEWLSEYRGD